MKTNPNAEQFIQDIVREAGKITLGFFKKAEVQYTKAHSLDVVTQADLASNKFLTEAIAKSFPDDGIISEETGESNTTAEYVWIIDPLDGTLNFSKNIPLYGVLVARAKGGIVQLAVIYDPIHDELYYAKRGAGAFLNGQKISCSKEVSIEDTVGVSSNGLKLKNLGFWQNVLTAMPSEKINYTSYFSLAISAAWTAVARRDWYMVFGGSLWDHAAPSLVLEESGCKVTNIDGEPWTFKDKTMLAANEKMHAVILGMIKNK